MINLSGLFFRLILLAFITFIFSGCTSVLLVKRNPDKSYEKAFYVYWFQNKENKLKYNPEVGMFELEAVNSSDPAIDAFEKGLALGKGAFIQ